MNRSQEIIYLFNESFSFASLQLSLPPPEAAAVEEANALIPPKKLFSEEEKDRGIAHITVFYGFLDDDFEQVQHCLQDYGPLKYAIIGKPKIFTNKRFNVFYFPIESPDLVKVHKYLRQCTGKEPPTFRQYKPHATFAYVLSEYTTVPKVTFSVIQGETTVLDFHRKDGQPEKIYLT